MSHPVTQSDPDLKAAITQLDSALKAMRRIEPLQAEDAQALDALLPEILKKLPGSYLTIVITGERAGRFRHAIGDVFDAANSLVASMTDRFPPHSGVQQGDSDPSLAIEGFTNSVTARASLMLSIIEGEEEQKQ
jgi:hypothetical protein